MTTTAKPNSYFTILVCQIRHNVTSIKASFTAGRHKRQLRMCKTFRKMWCLCCHHSTKWHPSSRLPCYLPCPYERHPLVHVPNVEIFERVLNVLERELVISRTRSWRLKCCLCDVPLLPKSMV